MVTKVLPSRLPPVVVASHDSADARAIKSILEDYISLYDIAVDGYDQFASCTTGRFTFNLLARYFERGKEPPTIFISSALQDGRGWIYEKSLTPGFYFCLGGGNINHDPEFGTTQNDIEKIGPSIGLQSTSEELRMHDLYRRCGENWEKVERFLEYGKQVTMVEIRHESNPFLHTADAICVITPKGITSRIETLDEMILEILFVVNTPPLEVVGLNKHLTGICNIENP